MKNPNFKYIIKSDSTVKLAKVSLAIFVPQSAVDKVVKMTGWSPAKATQQIVRAYKDNASGCDCEGMEITGHNGQYYIGLYDGREDEYHVRIETPFWG